MFVNRSVFSLGETGLLMVSLINTFLFILTVQIALKYASIDSKLLPTICVLGFFLFLFWFTPEVFAEVILWRTGSIQYFWGSVIALIVIHPLIESVFENEQAYSRWQAGLYLVLCFIGGSWLENLSVAIIPIWIAMLCQIKFTQNRNLNKIHLLGLCAWTLGTILLIIAPGNYVRAETINDSTTIWGNFFPVLHQIYEHLDKSLILVYLLFGLILLWTNPENSRQKFCQSGIFMAMAILSILSMIAAPASSFLDRAAFPFEFFMIFATVSLFPNKLFSEQVVYLIPSRIFTTISGLLFLSVLSNYIQVHRAYAEINLQESMRGEIVALGRNANTKNIIELPALFLTAQHNTIDGRLNKGHFFASDITRDSRHWRNECYAKAHKVPGIKLVNYSPLGSIE